MLSILFSFSKLAHADGSVCNTDALLSIMSDSEMDKFKDKLCVHYYANEFSPQPLSMDVCQNLVVNCRPTLIDFGHNHFPGKDTSEVVNEDMIDFLESIQQINLIEDEYNKQIGNVEFFRAINDSFSKEELATIPSCSEMKVFSNVTECLTYEGMSADDARFLQNYANTHRISQLTSESDKILKSISDGNENLSEAKRDQMLREVADLQKKIDERVMHNGLKNIDYKNRDLLFEKLLPMVSSLSKSFDEENDSFAVFQSFLPGHNVANKTTSEKKTIGDTQTDLILGFWWQMKLEQGENPSEALAAFFSKNPANSENLKEVLHKLRLELAKEHAAEACSESSRALQKKFNDRGSVCSIMNENRRAAKIKYDNFEDYISALEKMSTNPNEKLSSDERDKQRIIYNSIIANKICSNKVEMMGPFQDNRLPPQKFKSKSWENTRKELQNDMLSKQEQSQAIISSYREEKRKINFDKSKSIALDSDLKKLKNSSDLKSETPAKIENSKSDKTIEPIKPKIENGLNPNSNNKNFNNYFGNNFGGAVNQPIKQIPVDNSASRLEREIESRLKVLDEQINNGRQNANKKDLTDEEKIIKDRSNLDELMREREQLQKNLKELTETTSAKKSKKVEAKPSNAIEDDEVLTNSGSGKDERNGRKSRDNKSSSTIASETNSTISVESPTAVIGDNKVSNKPGSISAIKTEFGLVLTKAGEPATDLNQMITNPSESDLMRLAEKSNGEPFLINENGELIRVLVKKDSKGKLVFEKVKLSSEQKKKLAIKKDTVRAIKEIGPAPIRKMELDKLMKETR